MADRVKGFIVTLENDMNDEDAELVRSAIQLLAPVVSVEPVGVENSDAINRHRIKRELADKIWAVLK